MSMFLITILTYTNLFLTCFIIITIHFTGPLFYSNKTPPSDTLDFKNNNHDIDI